MKAKKMCITITKKETGFVCVADNGELPFEGRIHNTMQDAVSDLNASYDNSTWHGVLINQDTYCILVD